MTKRKNTEINEVYREWRSLVNMTKLQLQRFLKTKEGKEAGLSKSEASELGITSGHTSAEQIIKMKDKPKSDWNENDIKNAKRHIGFIKRMSGNKGDLFDEKGKKTRKHTSLLLWGHNPLKFKGKMALGGSTDEVFYHVSDRKFEDIKDIKPYIHIGTKEASEKRSEDFNYGNNAVYNVFSFEKKPRVKVVTDRFANLFSSYFRGIDITPEATEEEIDEIKRIGERKYTALRYKNEIEGGDSYLVIQPKILKIENVEVMEDGGEVLLAPNGKPSNLNAEQYKLVRSPEFKSWFGYWETDPENASKVVDDNGEPLVVYHGTNSEFNVFKEKLSAYYFAVDEKYAEFIIDYKGRTSSARVIPLFLNIRTLSKVDWEIENKNVDRYLNSWEYLRDMPNGLKGLDAIDDDYYFDKLKKENINTMVYVVFDNKNIKLADGTNTTFDSSNPDIRFESGGSTNEATIQCSNCDWEWKVEEGGDDLYICHKCGNDNEKNYAMKKGGETNITQDLTFYRALASGDTFVEVLYMGLDEGEADPIYQDTDILEQEGAFEVLAEKQVNTYKFVGEFDPKIYDSVEEMIEDYPLEDFYEDSQYWQLLNEGEWETYEVEKVHAINTLTDKMIEKVRDYINDKYIKAYYSDKYMDIDVYDDENEENLGCIQVRVADHTQNYANINRFGGCDKYLSIVIADKDKTKNKFLPLGRELHFDSNNTYEEIITEVDNQIEDLIEDIKNSFSKGGEILKGGNADKLNLEAIAVIHDVDVNYLKTQLQKGIKVEMEHTNDRQIAKEIALDHLVESPEYYKQLEKMEKKFDKGGNTNSKKTVRTTSLKHYKELKAKGINAELVTKSDLNKMRDGGSIQNNSEEFMTIQPQLFSENKISDTPSLFSENKKTRKFEYGGSITDIGNWNDVPNEWKNTSKISKVTFTDSVKDKNFLKIVKPFAAKDELRPVLYGAYFTEDQICVTDANRLIVLPNRSDIKDEVISVIDNKKQGVSIGDKIEGSYPNYKAVIPTKESVKSYKIDVYKALQFVQAALNYTNKITKAVKFKVDDDFEIGFNGQFMTESLKACLMLGYESIYFHKTGLSDRAMVLTPNENYDVDDISEFLILVMPVMLLGGIEDENYSAMDLYYNTSLKVFFDVSKNEIVNADGSVAKFKMDYGKGVLFSDKDVALLNKFRGSRSTLPILEQIAVVDGYLRATDLEASIKIKQSKAKDGVYSIKNKVPYIDSSIEVEQFPLFPDKSEANKIFTIDKDFFKFVVDKAINYVGNDELRPVMSGVNIKKDFAGRVILAATDAHILMRYDLTEYCKNINDLDFDFTIKPNYIKDLLMHVESQNIEVFSSEDYTFLECESIEVAIKNTDYKYLSYEAVIPQSFSNSLTIDVADLKNALESKDLKDLKNKLKNEYRGEYLKFTGEKTENGKLEFYGIIESNNTNTVFDKEKLGDTELNEGNGGSIDLNCLLIMPMFLGDLPNAIFSFNPDYLLTLAKFGKDKTLDMLYNESNKAYVIQGEFLDYDKPKMKYVGRPSKREITLANIEKNPPRSKIDNLVSIMTSKVKNQGYSLKELYDETLKMLGSQEGALVFSEFIKRKKDEGDKKIIEEFNKTSFVENINTTNRQDNISQIISGLKLMLPDPEIEQVIKGLELLNDEEVKFEKGGEINSLEKEEERLMKMQFGNKF